MNKIFIIFLVIIIVNVILIYTKKSFINKDELNDLDKNGFQLLPNFLNNNEINMIQNLTANKKLLNIKKYIIKNKEYKIKKILNNDYMFQDYIWYIMKSNVHTCHRDNNGKFFNENQKYDSYTILIFIEDMDRCLDVIPKSHKSKYNNAINLSDYTRSVPCKKGDALLFNANLIHTGSFNKKPNNLRIQMKVSHKDDIKQLSYYQDFNKYVDKENNIPKPIKYLQKNLSCTYPVFSDLTQKTNINTSRGSSDKNVKIPLSQKIFSYLFYGDSNYYDLPDITK